MVCQATVFGMHIAILTLMALVDVTASIDSKGVRRPLNIKREDDGRRHLKGGKGGKGAFPKLGDFEVWASDQSNSVANLNSLGIGGSFLWIWDSDDIETQLETGVEAIPLTCVPKNIKATGPCDLLDVFPDTLAEYSDASTPTGDTLADLTGFGRLHGMLKDPTNRYVTASVFAPFGGFLGVIDTLTKEAIALFRVTEFNFGGGSPNRSNHMSFFSNDGKHIIIANLNGKAVERIDVTWDKGTITQLTFNKSATLGLGSAMSVANDATFFKGPNAFGRQLIGAITGDYNSADITNDFTPNGKCKENGCGTPAQEGAMGGRPNNLIICPISAESGNTFITLAGGGLLVAHIASTPMKIVGEYGNALVYGAGCGGAQATNGRIFLNSGVSASSGGAVQSMFAVQSFDDTQYPMTGMSFNPENMPIFDLVYQDVSTNTKSNGNIEGRELLASNSQLPTGPNKTDRRDAHGAVAVPTSKDGSVIHIVDRIQNVVESFDQDTYERTTYDLTSATGKDGRFGPLGACFKRSVMDDPLMPLNDPAPDLLDVTPDGNYLMVALRGPAPVTVSHSAQGSCPGVGIIQLSEDKKSGKLVEVLRSRNLTPDTVTVNPTGGHAYSGAERSDIHGAIVVARDIY